MRPTFVSSCTRKSSEDRRTQLNSCESSYPEDRRDSEVLHSQRYWAIAPGLNSAALLARRPATTASRSTSFYFFAFLLQSIPKSAIFKIRQGNKFLRSSSLVVPVCRNIPESFLS